MSWKSAIYRGWVHHRRHEPREHEFRYPLFMMYLDLDELPDLFRNRWFWSSEKPALARFDRRDHQSPYELPLDLTIRDMVEVRTGRRPLGPIRLLTHLRYFGHCFNPVSFYYCFEEEGETVQAIVAEVNNTPWGERHCYVLDSTRNLGTMEQMIFEGDKEFHVSPFMGMEMRYQWRFTHPGDTLVAHMKNLENEEEIFNATLSLQRREITGPALAGALADSP